jgi:hypothetical protein
MLAVIASRKTAEGAGRDKPWDLPSATAHTRTPEIVNTSKAIVLLLMAVLSLSGYGSLVWQSFADCRPSG